MAFSMSFNFRFLMIRFIVLCHVLPTCFPLQFIYDGFNTTYADQSLHLDGAASITKPPAPGVLKLTTDAPNIIGHAFHSSPISPIFPNSSFSTHFVFQIVPSGDRRGGFGLGFTLSPTPAFPGAQSGHYMGVFNSSNDGSPSNHIFMVEFDTVKGHNETSDSHGNHIGVNINGMKSSVHQTPELDLELGEPIQAWIDYDGINKVVNVTVFPKSAANPALPLTFGDIDLSGVVVETMYAGFSAATGNKASFHYILGWSFSLNGKADPLNFTRLPAVPVEKNSSSSNTPKNKLTKPLLAALSIILFLLLVALAGIFCYRKVMEYEVLEDWERDCPHRFGYKALHRATKGFNETEKIGAGGFGAVYRGVLPATGAEVAVKKIMSNNELKGMREFAAEIESLGRLRHKNLVNLQGWCKHKNNLLLVYDYVPNGSLDSLLYDDRNRVLSWDQRFNIIKGVASGLLYLHEEWEQVVIHRDIKSSNVLIDRDMNARLGDFGLARSYDHGKNAHTTNVVGTVGYIAPELTQTGKASASTDVFAYGILLLEVACGRAPVVCEADRNVILVDWVMECFQAGGNVYDAVDPKLKTTTSYKSEEVELVLGLGLLCSHPNPEGRPTMKQVMKYLNGDEVLPLLDEVISSSSRRRRVDEITARFLALGLMLTADGDVNNTASTASNRSRSQSLGAMSTSFGSSGR